MNGNRRIDDLDAFALSDSLWVGGDSPRDGRRFKRESLTEFPDGR